LASAYNDLDYIMDQDIDTGMRLIIKARERQEESRQWQLYCSIYPHFTKENFIPFDKFYKKAAPRVSMKSKEQIVKEGYKLKKLFEAK
jgi:hypothetical protein